MLEPGGIHKIIDLNAYKRLYLTPQGRNPRFAYFHYSSMVRVFAHGVMGRRIDPSWG